jgi:hypothetical protein
MILNRFHRHTTNLRSRTFGLMARISLTANGWLGLLITQGPVAELSQREGPVVGITLRADDALGTVRLR